MKKELISILSASWPIIAIILTIVIIIRIAYIKNHKKKVSLLNEIMLLLFVTYILILFQLVTYEQDYNGVNLMPLKEILRYDFGTPGFMRQVVGNIVLFIPIGFFITYYASIKNIGSAFLATLASSLVIETVQYFIGRSFDVDDIILNVIGGVLGFLIFVALDAVKKHLPSFFQKDIIYVILSILLIIFIILNIFGYISF